MSQFFQPNECFVENVVKTEDSAQCPNFFEVVCTFIVRSMGPNVAPRTTVCETSRCDYIPVLDHVNCCRLRLLYSAK